MQQTPAHLDKVNWTLKNAPKVYIGRKIASSIISVKRQKQTNNNNKQQKNDVSICSKRNREAIDFQYTLNINSKTQTTTGILMHDLHLQSYNTTKQHRET